MPIESFRLRARPGSAFVFAAAGRPERLHEISAVLGRAGGRVIGPGAWALDGEGGTLAEVANLFERLEKDECVYVLRSDGGELTYGMIAEANTQGGVVVAS
jgi:hypothetical protein